MLCFANLRINISENIHGAQRWNVYGQVINVE